MTTKPSIPGVVKGIPELSGCSFPDIDSVIIKLKNVNPDSVMIYRLVYHGGKFVGEGRLKKWLKTELWIMEAAVPARKEFVSGREKLIRVVIKNHLAIGVYAVCIPVDDNDNMKTQYYDFKIE